MGLRFIRNFVRNFINEAANSFDAFSNVRMEQGDTLFVYADELEYSGVDEMAVLYAYPPKPKAARTRPGESSPAWGSAQGGSLTATPQAATASVR